MHTAHPADLRLDQISHRYGPRQPLVLQDISFTVPGGQALSLVGRSGCGKSTLLHLIAGLNRPSAGVVRIGNEEVHAPSARWVMMFQQPLLYPWMTVYESASLALRFAGQLDKAPSIVGELLDIVGLAAYAGTNVQNLSGGQQQRVALARALAAAPEILLLDEPFSALDAFTRADLQRDVRAIARRLGLTLILVTHDIEEAVRMSDRALVMNPNPGRIVADLEFHLPTDRDSDDVALTVEKARLLAALGETTAVPQPGNFYEI